MSRHISVLDKDRTPVPRLDWRSGRTWGVFLGFWLAFSTTTSLVIILCALAAERLVRDEVARVLVGMAPAFALCGIAYVALKRALPLRDAAGHIVPGNPRPEIAMLSYFILFPLVWVVGHGALWVWLSVLARDVLEVFPETFPVWGGGLIGGLSLMFVEFPVRILWRMPRPEEVNAT